MLVAKYKGDLYNVDESNSFDDGKIEIFAYEKKEGFQQQKYSTITISSKQLFENELEAIYDIDFYAVWNGERFDIWSRKKQIICLWKFCGNSEYADKYGFQVSSKCEYLKEVQIEECDYFIMSFCDYYDVKKPAEEVKLSKEQFVNLYKKFVCEM